MTDKLQDVVEQWIAEKQFSVLETGKRASECKSMCIEVDDLRIFLAQYVLRDKEPAAWQAEANNGIRTVVIFRCEAPIGNTNYKPLHAPAKEVNSEG